MPELFGVRPSYALIHNWRLAEGHAFTPQDNEAGAAVCVLGEAAKVSLFGYGSALDKYVKVNDTWLRVIGSLQEQTASGSSLSQDPNQVIYTPLRTMQYRFFDVSGYLKDELDGVDVRLKTGADSRRSRPRSSSPSSIPLITTRPILPSPFRPNCWPKRSGRKPSLPT